MEPWSASYELGVPAMDAAHRALDGMVLDAIAAVERSDTEALAATLASLGATIVPHFQEEEGMMRRSKFPGTAEHATAHATFLGEVGKAHAEFTRNGLSPLFRLWFGSRLAPWLRVHVRGLDAQMARYFRAWEESEARHLEASLVAEAKQIAAVAAAGEAAEGSVPEDGIPKG
jgi:hemerythrin-like metal-binding protein